MARNGDEMRRETICAHLAAAVSNYRTAYLQALDDAFQFVIDEATTPSSSRTRLAPGASCMANPGQQIWDAFESDGHLITWVAGATDATPHRLNRTDLTQAAARLGLLDALPELSKGRPA